MQFDSRADCVSKYQAAKVLRGGGPTVKTILAAQTFPRRTVQSKPGKTPQNWFRRNKNSLGGLSSQKRLKKA
jgi:hypothetical protein